MNIVWTDERIDLLRSSWGKASAAELARQIGCTRNAVIGKINRLGLNGTTKAERIVQAARRRAERPPTPKRLNRFEQTRGKVARAFNRQIAAPVVEPDPVPVIDVPDVVGCGLLDLSDTRCHFPIGDPQAPGFGHCGEAISEGCIYCDRHRRIMYRPIRVRS